MRRRVPLRSRLDKEPNEGSFNVTLGPRLPVGGDVGYESLIKGNDLRLPRGQANVHQEAVYLKYPDQRVIVQLTGQAPLWLERN